MVYKTLILSTTPSKRKFLDHVRLFVKGGRGGQGLPKYGGCGGKGGSVIAEASEKVTLKNVTQKFPNRRLLAKSGENSRVTQLLGKQGHDTIVKVPPGVSIVNDAGRILGELNSEGQRMLLAQGGSGGGPATEFKGQPGHAFSIRMDLKLIADIGLVGFPNAGKSSLLSALSRASPRIASYPFTTIKPQIGIMQYEDHRQISMADLPGLIEGAHINVGMGHSFLKHVERTKLLLFVVDINGFQLSPNHKTRTAVETVLLLNKELELYKTELLQKPAVLVLNKIDTEGGEDRGLGIKDQLENMEDTISTIDPSMIPENLIEFEDIVTVSAKEKINTENMTTMLRLLLDHFADLEFEKQKYQDQHLDLKLVEHFKGNIEIH